MTNYPATAGNMLACPRCHRHDCQARAIGKETHGGMGGGLHTLTDRYQQAQNECRAIARVKALEAAISEQTTTATARPSRGE